MRASLHGVSGGFGSLVLVLVGEVVPLDAPDDDDPGSPLDVPPLDDDAPSSKALLEPHATTIETRTTVSDAAAVAAL